MIKPASSPRTDATDTLAAILKVASELGLSAGSKLPGIRELANRLAVRPTVVRDALLRAESRGLVNVQARSGVYLCQRPEQGDRAASMESRLADMVSNDHNVLHLLDARRLIEIELAGRAATNCRVEDLLPVRRALDAMLELPAEAPRPQYVALDVRFHLEIARLAGNSALLAIQRALMEMLVPHLNDVPEPLQRRINTDASHVAIYESLVAGQAERARKEMQKHLSLAYDGLVKDLQRAPDLKRAGRSMAIPP